MRILITGGLGFIGSNLAEKCVEDGNKVTIVSKSTSKKRNIESIEDRVRLLVMDVKDIGKEVEEFDYIFHLAGSTDNYAIIENQPFKDIELNCNTTIALLEACRRYNPQTRIVYGSTFFVNGNQEKLPVDENSPCNPLGLYGATRLAGEHFCHIYNKVFGLNANIARFTNVFGIREQRDNKKKAGFNYLINLALEDRDIPLYNNGEFFRDYIYVSDVVDACRVIAEKGEKDKVYYVGRGEFVRFRELISMVMEEAKGGRIKSIEPPEFHKSVGITNFVCDSSQLRKLGWEPKVSLTEGIRKTIEYYKNG